MDSADSILRHLAVPNYSIYFNYFIHSVCMR